GERCSESVGMTEVNHGTDQLQRTNPAAPPTNSGRIRQLPLEISANARSREDHPPTIAGCHSHDGRMTARDWAIIARGTAAILLVIAVIWLLTLVLGQLQGTLTGTFG